MRELPFGTVTFLFTDIEGSTKLWEQYPEVMKTALAKHDFILKEAIESNHGHVIKNTGDGVHAVTATITAQTALHSAFIIHAERSSFSLKVRMGIHSSEAELRDGDDYGGTLNRAARLMSVAHGGQVLLSNATMELVREQLPAGVTLRDLGEHRLKDLTHPELPSEFPPIKTLDAFPTRLVKILGIALLWLINWNVLR